MIYKKRQQSYCRYLGLGLLALSLANLAIAQDDSEVPTLDEIVVLGMPQEKFNVAITEEFINERQIVDLEGMFRHEPSITVGGGLPVAQKIYVRGLEDTLLNVTIDGATQAGYLYHHQGRINVEPELIKSVVIEAGAGRATTGPGALGGAIHFTTVNGADLLKDGQQIGVLAKSGFQSVSEGWKNHVSIFGNLSESFSVLASFTKLDADNYEDGNGDEVALSAVNQEDWFIKVGGQINAFHSISASYEQRTDNETRFSRPNMVGLFHPVYPSTPVPQETERESLIVNYGFNPDGELLDLKVTAYYNDNVLTKQGDMFLDHWPPSPPFTFTDYYNGRAHGGGVESLGLNARNDAIFGNHTIVYGLEYRSDSAYLVNGITPGFQDEETDIQALYAQTEFALSDVVSLHVGARFDDYDYTDNQGVNINDNGFSSNASVHFQINAALEIYAGYAEAFKGVSSPEIWFLEFPPAGLSMSSYTGPNSTDANGITSGALAAEESDNIEVGFRLTMNKFLASGEIFQQNIENAQFASTTSRFSYKDTVEADGYALRFGYVSDNFSANIGVSETEPTLNGEPLSSGDMGLGTAYGRTWTGGVDYTFAKLALSIGWNMRLVEDLSFVRASQDEKDGYNIHDVYLKWEAVPAVNVGVAISNLADEFYYDQGTFFTQAAGEAILGLPQPGRNIKAAVSYQF